MAEVAKAWVTVIPTVKGAQKAVESSVVPAASSAGAKAGNTMGTGIVAGLKKHKAAIASAVGVAAISKGAKESVDAFTSLASSTKSLQRVTGGTAAEVSSLSGAMRLSGMDTSKANASLTIFAKNMTKAAAGNKTAASAFASLGVSATGADGSVRSMNELLPELADKFASMPDGASKTAAAVALFGRSGTAMLPFLNKGASGISELQAKAEELGIVLDDQSMSTFSAYKGATREMSTALEGMKVKAGEAFAPFVTGGASAISTTVIPALQAAAQAVTDFADGLTSGIDAQGFLAAFQGIGDAVNSAFGGEGQSNATGFGQALGSALNGLVPVIEAAKPAVQALASGVKALADNAQTAVPLVLGVVAGVKGMSLAQTVASGVKGVASGIASIAARATGAATGLTATAAAERAAGSAATGSATQILAVAAAVVAIGAGIALASAGMYLLAQAAVTIASSGAGAAVAMVGMVGAIAGLAVGAAVLGPALTAGAVGMVAFGAAVLMVGAGIAVASAGMALLASQTPVLAAAGPAAAAGLAAIAAGCALLGPACVAGAAGLVAIAAPCAAAGLAMAALGLALGDVPSKMAQFGWGASAAASGIQVIQGCIDGLGDKIGAAGDGAGKAVTGFTQLAQPVTTAASAMATMAAASMTAATACNALANAPRRAAAGFAALKAQGTASMAALAAKVKQSMSAIRAAFATKLKLQVNRDLALPHFKMSGKVDGKKGTVPTVSVSWYKTGGVFSQPTVVGVGDAKSPEIVAPQDMMRDTFEGVLDSRGGGTTVNVALNYDAGADANQMARDIAAALRRAAA